MIRALICAALVGLSLGWITAEAMTVAAYYDANLEGLQ